MDSGYEIAYWCNNCRGIGACDSYVIMIMIMIMIIYNNDNGDDDGGHGDDNTDEDIDDAKHINLVILKII